MPNTSEDPVDHARTTRQHAGETMKDGTNAPGLIGVALGVIALCAALFAFAAGYQVSGTILAVVAVAAGLAGSVWLAVRHRRVRDTERRWRADNPGAPAEPPTS